MQHRHEAIRLAHDPPHVPAHAMLPRNGASTRSVERLHPVRAQHEQFAYLAIHRHRFEIRIARHRDMAIERLHQVRPRLLAIRPHHQARQRIVRIHRTEPDAARRLRNHPHAPIRHRIALEPLAHQLPHPRPLRRAQVRDRRQRRGRLRFALPKKSHHRLRSGADRSPSHRDAHMRIAISEGGPQHCCN